jgi:hypothetical protein
MDCRQLIKPHGTTAINVLRSDIACVCRSQLLLKHPILHSDVVMKHVNATNDGNRPVYRVRSDLSGA